MSIRDEYVAVLREVLGEGYESATLSILLKDYAKVTLKPKVLAKRKAALDNSALQNARVALEEALRTEAESLKAAEAALVTQLDLDVETL